MLNFKCPSSIQHLRVANEGVLAAGDIDVVLRLDDPNSGVVLGSEKISEVVPGSYHDVSFTLNDMPFGIPIAYAVLDANDIIDEFDEDNNISSARIFNYAPGDFDEDLDVDIIDFSTFVNQWLNSGSRLSADIYPIGGDGIVNMKDYAEIMRWWMWRSLPMRVGLVVVKRSVNIA